MQAVLLTLSAIRRNDLREGAANMNKFITMAFLLGAYVALPAFLILGWLRWVRQRQTGDTWISLTGFSLGTASALLAVGAIFTRVP